MEVNPNLSPESQKMMQDMLDIGLPEQIDQSTAPEDNTQQWHDMRRNGFGGSDMMTMFGLSPFSTPLDLWKLKRGEVQPSPASPAAARGTMMEPHVVRRAEQALGINVSPGMKFFKHPRWSEGVRIQANTDGMVQGQASIFEAKTCGRNNTIAKAYQEGLVPLSHMLQLHAYLFCLRMDRAVIACVEGPRDPSAWTPDCGVLHVLEVTICEDLRKPIEVMAKRFWASIESGEPPSFRRHPWAPSVSRIAALHQGVKTLYRTPT